MADVTEKTLRRVSNLMNELYPDDVCKPGVLTSYLDHKKVWYVAAHRYWNRGQEKTILAHAEDGDLVKALEMVERNLLTPKYPPRYVDYYDNEAVDYYDDDAWPV